MSAREDNRGRPNSYPCALPDRLLRKLNDCTSASRHQRVFRPLGWQQLGGQGKPGISANTYQLERLRTT